MSHNSVMFEVEKNGLMTQARRKLLAMSAAGLTLFAAGCSKSIPDDGPTSSQAYPTNQLAEPSGYVTAPTLNDGNTKGDVHPEVLLHVSNPVTLPDGTSLRSGYTVPAECYSPNKSNPYNPDQGSVKIGLGKEPNLDYTLAPLTTDGHSTFAEKPSEVIKQMGPTFPVC